MDSASGIFTGLVTLTFSSLISIKALRVVFNVNRDNKTIVVNGDGNSIAIVQHYNKEISEGLAGYELLWPAMFVLLFLVFPFFSNMLCQSLYFVAWLCPLVALVAFVVCVTQLSLRRIWDFMYILASGLLSWITIFSFDFIKANLQLGDYLKKSAPLFNVLPEGAIYVAMHGELESAIASLIICLGFCSLFLAHFWIAFSFVAWRNFSDILRRSGNFLFVGTIGAMLATGVFAALHEGQYPYILRVFHSVADPVVNLLS
jgi:hypothetical protein